MKIIGQIINYGKNRIGYYVPIEELEGNYYVVLVEGELKLLKKEEIDERNTTPHHA